MPIDMHIEPQSWRDGQRHRIAIVAAARIGDATQQSAEHNEATVIAIGECRSQQQCTSAPTRNVAGKEGKMTRHGAAGAQVVRDAEPVVDVLVG